LAKLVLFSTYSDVYQALCAKAALDAAGLFVMVPDQNAGQTNWPGVATLGNVRLLVLDEDVEAARAILDDEALPKRDAVSICPVCSSTRISRFANPVFGFLTAFLIGIPGALHTHRYVCHDCKHRWKKDPDLT